MTAGSSMAAMSVSGPPALPGRTKIPTLKEDGLDFLDKGFKLPVFHSMGVLWRKSRGSLAPAPPFPFHALLTRRLPSLSRQGGAHEAFILC